MTHLDMTHPDMTHLDITHLARALAGKKVSPVEVVSAYLARIERHNPSLLAYISVYPEQALAAARQAEQEIMAGRYRGPLHGIPLAVKDLFQVAGMRRTGGSLVLPRRAAREDATAVGRLRQGGAILLGTLNLHELAFGATGTNPHFGTARNPWDHNRICGGSSSGSAAATAAHLAAGTLGTDTGGSIRIPASLCGVVGLKPTYGLVSSSGIWPMCRDFDHPGPIARSVGDAALLLQAMAGPDLRDPATLAAPVGDFAGNLKNSPEGLRVGIPEAYFFDHLHPEVEAAVRKAIARLQELGMSVRGVALPPLGPVLWAWKTICHAETAAFYAPILKTRGHRLGPDILRRLHTGAKVTAAQYVKARAIHAATRREMALVLEQVELLATPTTPIPAAPIKGREMVVRGKKVQARKVLGSLVRLACFTGQPAISLPCGFTRGGLPIGLQLMGRWWDDAALLRAAHAYEQATDWHTRTPPEIGGTAGAARNRP